MNPGRDYRAARSQLLEEAGIRSSYASGAEIVEQENERDLGEVHDRVNVLSSGAPVFRNGPVQKFVSRKFVRSNGPVLDDTLLADPEIVDAIENEKSVEKKLKISDVDRSVVGRVGGAIAKKYGAAGFAGEIKLLAGQSFGCFLTPGLYLRLVGEANDYVGKGMAGGKIVISPPVGSGFKAEDATIVGNTCLYGATGGQLFANGKAGERFAVRNSLAEAVIEGTGDHACEYMTGGCIVAIGKVGRNVAAGMTGGLGYFLDEDNTFPTKVNKEIVKMQRVNAPAGQQQLQRLLQSHVDETGSSKGKEILANWDKYLPLFWQLVPPSEEETPEANADAEDRRVESLVAQAA